MLLSGRVAGPARLAPRANVRALRAESALLYLQVAMLMAVTFVAGRAGIGAIRYVFIAGCVAIAYQAWRAGPARHIEISIILFVFAPFLRRVVDFSAGFDPVGYMLMGPVLGLLPPCIDLYHWLVTGRRRQDMGLLGPYILMGLCLLYGTTVSLAQGDFLPTIVQLSKLLPPLTYGLWMAARAGETPDVIDGAARGFMITMPLAGLYGLYQFFYPPEWDAYWLIMTAANSMGSGESEKIRVFGPMNSPASLGHFMMAGILVIAFAQRSLMGLLLCVPMFVGLMLSSVRAAWVGLAVGIVYCWLHGSTRARAQLVIVWGAAAIALILATSSFGDAVIDRFSTFAAPEQDGSAQGRSGDFAALIDDADHLVVGLGLGGLGSFDISKPQVNLIPTEATDGIVVSSILTLGVVVGSLYMLGVVWACAQGLIAVQARPTRRMIAASAVVLGNAVVLPLTAVTSGEIGFLFWAFLGMISVARSQRDDAFEDAAALPLPKLPA